MKHILTLGFASALLLSTNAADTPVYKTEINIPYRSPTETTADTYINERCRLDVYYPTNNKNFATIVWFHGGGLRSGKKSIPKKLKNKGHTVVAANYRLFPKIKCPTYIEDAAAAIAWTFKNIDKYGGEPNIFCLRALGRRIPGQHGGTGQGLPSKT